MADSPTELSTAELSTSELSKSEQCDIVVLISGNGSNLQAIIDAISTGQLPARIAAVISNKAAAYGLQRASQAGIATEVLEYAGYADRDAYDRALMNCIDHYQPQLIVLAGFMRILSDGFVEHYTGRMLNIHPSLLPNYKGLNTHQRVLDAGEQEHGATVHFVTPELDSGPVVLQGVIQIAANENADTLADRVHSIEHLIYPKAIHWFATGRLGLHNNQVTLDGQALTDKDKIYRS